jgi:riboflavin-specific deaminase-like protein
LVVAALDEDRLWSLLLSANRLAREGELPFDRERVIWVDSEACLSLTPPAVGGAPALVWRPGSRWRAGAGVTWTDASALALLDLYLPLWQAERNDVELIAHLGQSLDGFIATTHGESRFVTGEANLRHLHRMRALSDAVLVGAGTIAADDPRLTTRLVAGPNPLRILLDPRRRLAASHRVFHDGEAETLLCCDAARLQPSERRFGRAHLLGVPTAPEGLDLGVLLGHLAERGIRRIFIEGGGSTVSRFLVARRLSRLQIAVAPILIGSGRPGVRLPPPERLDQALRPAMRLFRMGRDLLYDLDPSARSDRDPATASAELVRLL